MKINILNLLLVFILSSCMKNYKMHDLKNGILKNNYNLIWLESFSENKLDTTKWNIERRRMKMMNSILY